MIPRTSIIVSKTHSLLSSNVLRWTCCPTTTINHLSTSCIRKQNDPIYNTSLPWIQNTKDNFRKEPLTNLIAGRLILSFFELRPREFCIGASQAIRVVAECIACPERNKELENYVDENLYFEFKKAFRELDYRNKLIQLDVGDPQRLNIVGARMVFDDPEGEFGSTYVFGTEFKFSNEDMQKFANSSEKWKLMEEIVDEMFQRTRIQTDLKFRTLETFSLVDKDPLENEDIVVEEGNPQVVYHLWTFENKNLIDEDWVITDIDHFLRNKNIADGEY